VLSEFLCMLMLVFAIITVFTGFFTVYFGSGTSRLVGCLLTILGLIFAVAFFFFVTGFMQFQQVWSLGLVLDSAAAVGGAIVGGLIGLGLFLAAIMKS